MFHIFSRFKEQQKIPGEGIEAFRNQVASWFQIHISFELKEHNFTEVINKPNKQNNREKIVVYTLCHVSFRNKTKTFHQIHGLINLSESSSEEYTKTLNFSLFKEQQKMPAEGLEVFRNQVTSWFQINIPFELKEHNFTKVPNKLNK